MLPEQMSHLLQTNTEEGMSGRDFHILRDRYHVKELPGMDMPLFIHRNMFHNGWRSLEHPELGCNITVKGLPY
jgi:hypothetical protein